MKYTIHYSGRFKKSYKLWKQNDTELTLLLLDTGTHSDVF